MTDEREHSDPTALAESASADGNAFRSHQKTLAMGGDVNHRERMPSLLELAEEFVEHAPPSIKQPNPEAREPEPTRLTDLARRAISEAPKRKSSEKGLVAAPPPSPPSPSRVPGPRAIDPMPMLELSVPDVQQPPSAPRWTPPGPRTAVPRLAELERTSRPTLPGLPAVSEGSALGSSALTQRGPETFSAQLLNGPSDAAQLQPSSGGSLLERFAASWAQHGRRRWARVGWITAAALGAGYGLGTVFSDEAEQPSAAVSPASRPAAAGEAPTRGADGPAAESSGMAHATESPATGVVRDLDFAVRAPRKADSCEDVLDAPFAAQAEPHGGKGAAFWSRSRRSLMNGQPRRAVEQMCLSASWDPSGRGTYGLSEYYFKESDFEQALAWARRVPKGSKRWGDARTMIGDAYGQLGRNDEALRTYLDHWRVEANASEERTKLAGRFANSAAMAVHKRDFWTAERFYRRAILLDPEHAFAAAGLARVFAHFELHDATVHWAERALSLDEERATQAAVALAETWIRQKNVSEAKKALDRLRRIEPGHPLAGSLASRIAELD